MRPYRIVSLFVSFVLITLPVLAQRPGGGRPGVGVSAPRNATTPGKGTHGPDLSGYYPGKHADEEDKVEFRTDTILVQVPVVITDKSEQHVHGLKKEDFRVIENGKEQTVASFEEVTATHKPVTIAQG